MFEGKEFYAIGHITNDVEPAPHVGGGVTYTAVGLFRLGYDAHIITKSPPDHPYVKELEDIGVGVHTLPMSLPMDAGTITTFENYYDKEGHREQRVPKVQEMISVGDMAFFPDIAEGSVILIAPVIAEVDPTLIVLLSEKGHVVVTPQGYFRQREPDGSIRRVRWDNLAALSSAKAVIFSDEDLTQNGSFQEQMLQRIRDTCPLAIMTQGANGATIFQEGAALPLTSFPLLPDEVAKGDFTGAGDTFSAGFIASYFEKGDVKVATAFGMLYAALKIAGIGGKGTGVETIPSLAQVTDYTQAHAERIQTYMRANTISTLLE